MRLGFHGRTAGAAAPMTAAIECILIAMDMAQGRHYLKPAQGAKLRTVFRRCRAQLMGLYRLLLPALLADLPVAAAVLLPAFIICMLYLPDIAAGITGLIAICAVHMLRFILDFRAMDAAMPVGFCVACPPRRIHMPGIGYLTANQAGRSARTG